MALADYINNKPVIETNRLIIRPMTVSDVSALKKWMPDKSIYTYWGKGPSKAEMNPELLFEKPERPAKSFHLGIAEKDSNEVIGDLWVYLIENDRMAQVAIRLSKEKHGKGYGTEALSAMTRFCFENTELQRLWTQVDVRNTDSVKMLEKCGYSKEGLIRQGKMVNTWCDYYVYGILASDIQQHTNSSLPLSQIKYDSYIARRSQVAWLFCCPFPAGAHAGRGLFCSRDPQTGPITIIWGSSPALTRRTIYGIF